MTSYPVFTTDDPPAPVEDWPTHPARDESHTLRAMPVQGIFGVERPDGSVSKCGEGYGFLVHDADGNLDILPLSQFKEQYVGADHVS